MPSILIADSGSTKTDWCLLSGRKRTAVVTQGLSPYFLSEAQMSSVISSEVATALGKKKVDEVYFYGTGCNTTANTSLVKKALKHNFKDANVHVDTDLVAAAKALCGDEKGIVCILGTGSNSCYYNGKKIVKNSPGIGYILGDEGSGAYLGRKVLQYYLYDTYDEDLRSRFDAQFVTNSTEILNNVYKMPLPNRYLASFALFLSQNRGHYMVENILEDGLNDFFFNHVYKYKESWSLPIHFVGGVAYEFGDVIKELCNSYELQPGRILRSPMKGLIAYHNKA